ncbi:MAG: RagB/SusD family nutrient uptake outer membrane protein [Bacteroidales bacterium]|nr:RagB/SusD family nutrient uptake outer membrane protein [Bacteroidales bacterium]
MKKSRNIILVTGLIMLFLSSCSDYLEETGFNADYKYYETAAGQESLIAASYQQTRWCAGSETQYAFEDLGTDIFMLGADGGHRDAFGQFLSTSMNSQNGNVAGFWNNNFSGIASCNLGLQYLEKSTALLDDIKAVRKGELLFLRAYYYYELAIQYGDIPLVTQPTDKPKTDYVRVPQKQIWAQIISDARQAYDLLPWADAAGKVMGDYGRASKGAAGHLLAKAYMFRYCDIFAKNQSDANMNEDRGGKATDLDSVIYYASRVCNYGAGAGTGSLHSLASDYSTLWGWDTRTGELNEYFGPEILFSVQYSTNHFYNNQAVTSVNSGGNQLHLYYTMYTESYPLVTNMGGGVNVNWGGGTAAGNIGISRSFVTGRPWRRLVQTPYFYSDDGLYAARNYETGKLGKLVDSRLYKAHVWVYYCNTNPSRIDWVAYSNDAGSFDPASIGMTAGDPRFGIGDTAMLLSMEDLSGRFPSGTRAEKLALARAMEKYWYVPVPSLILPQLREETSNRDAITNGFPTLIKHLDGRRSAVNDQAAFKNFIRMRLGETYILLSEAYARKGDFSNAAATLNFVRLRGAWKEGEVKHAQYWKYDGGTWATRAASTENDMEVSAEFLGSQNITDFYVDEMGRETIGELNRFDCLVRYGSDYWLDRVKSHNYFATPYVKSFHRFRPIPQSHIDLIDPPDPNPQNYGY